MSSSDIETARRDSGVWLMAAGASALFVMASGCLLLLLWKVVPTYAAVLEGLEITPSPLTRVVFAASMWTGRMAPFLMFVGVAVCGLLVGGAAALAGRRGSRRAIGVAAAVVFMLALVEILASGLVVYCVRNAAPQADAADKGR